MQLLTHLFLACHGCFVLGVNLMRKRSCRLQKHGKALS